MPRYHFNIRQGNLVQVDNQGRDLANLDAARSAAAEAVLELLKAEGTAMTGAVVEICDDKRDVISTVPVDKAAGASVSPAGPHAKSSLTDNEKTPGAGVMAERTIDGAVDPGAG